MKKKIITKTVIIFTLFLFISSPAHAIFLPYQKTSINDTEHFSPSPNLFSPSPSYLDTPLISYFNTYFKYHLPFKTIPRNNGFTFTPENVTLTDDAFHGSESLHFTEWWYFDAQLTENYTLQFSIHVYDIFNQGFLIVNFNLYQNYIPIAQKRTMYPLSDIYLSTYNPLILIEKKLIMLGTYDENANQWFYTISYDIDNISFTLNYQSRTKGWKGTTPAGEWAVILPRAHIEGSLTINNSIHQVKGLGYHDHNWDVTILTGINFGWIWGKTNSPTYTLTWSNILTTWYQNNPLMVINEEYGNYLNIPLEDLEITVTDFSFKNGMIIPYGFQIIAHTRHISLSVNIEVLNVDYRTVLGLINYWRYHIHCTGFITVNGKTEDIDDHNIAEFIRFRFY